MFKWIDVLRILKSQIKSSNNRIIFSLGVCLLMTLCCLVIMHRQDIYKCLRIWNIMKYQMHEMQNCDQPIFKLGDNKLSSWLCCDRITVFSKCGNNIVTLFRAPPYNMTGLYCQTECGRYQLHTIPNAKCLVFTCNYSLLCNGVLQRWDSNADQ